MARPKSTSIRIALLADVHCNLPALEAVLVDAHKRGFDRLRMIKTTQRSVDDDVERAGRAIHAAGLSRPLFEALVTGCVAVNNE